MRDVSTGNLGGEEGNIADPGGGQGFKGS